MKNKANTFLVFCFIILLVACNHRDECYEFGIWEVPPPKEYTELTKIRVLFDSIHDFSQQGFLLQLIDSAKFGTNTVFNYSTLKAYPYPNGNLAEHSFPIFIDRTTMRFRLFFKGKLIDTLYLNYDLTKIEKEVPCADESGKWWFYKVSPTTVGTYYGSIGIKSFR